MKDAAIHVTVETQEEGTREDAPFDPNLVCPMRLGSKGASSRVPSSCVSTVTWIAVQNRGGTAVRGSCGQV